MTALQAIPEIRHEALRIAGEKNSRRSTTR